MASKVVTTHSAVPSWRTSTSSLRRIKSHEPGQRVMTEAIAFLFTYYTPLYESKTSALPPSAEEFVAYVRNLSLQTYHACVPVPRRQLNSRLLGTPVSDTPFESMYEFLDFIQPCRRSGLVSQLIQAQNIGLYALITYTAFIDDDSEKTLKTHIVEPYVWYSSILFHDLLEYRSNCMGTALRYIQNGVEYLTKHAGKRRVSAYFDAYSSYEKSNAEVFQSLYKYLVVKLYH